LEKRIYDMPSNLSLKDRKLLGIVRALATEPELLLLDEPVGGLSVEEIDEVSERILKMQEQGLTLLFIEHRMELVTSVSERVIVLNFGQKLIEGTFDEIQKNEQVIEAYLGKEAE
jgi:branched-chain amino acid transport system ATP-binding protein